MKELIEKRNALLSDLEALLEKAKTETRAFSDEEGKRFDELEKEIAALDETIAREERASSLKLLEREAGGEASGQESNDVETRAFAHLLIHGQPAPEHRGIFPETRNAPAAPNAQSTSLNENIIPTQFSNDIIRQVTELSGVFNSIRRINSPGVYRQFLTDNVIQGGWAAELKPVPDSTATFSFVDIGHHRYSVDVTISKEIENQSHFNIVAEVTRQIAEDFAINCEQAVIQGDGQGKPLGLMRGGTLVTLKGASAITADELVRVQGSLKSPMNYGASWIMSRETLLAVRLLKDANGNYLFHEGDLQGGFRNYYVLGRPVAISEAMENFEVLYGNFGKGYIGNVRPEMSITVNPYIKADIRATVIHGDIWFDGRPVNNQAYVKAVSAARAAKLSQK